MALQNQGVVRTSPPAPSSNSQTVTVAPSKNEKEMVFTPHGDKDAIRLSINIVKSLIATPTKSGALPSDAECTRFLMLCHAKKLNPYEGDAYLIGYDTKYDGPKFSLITAHQAFLKRAELHHEYDGMQSGVIILVETETGEGTQDIEGDFHLPNQQVVGGWATVHFKSRKIPTTRRLRLARFNKGFGVWNEDPAGMIVKCAEADALRSSFPTMCGGLYMREELPAMEVETTTTVQKVPARETPPQIFSPPTPQIPQGSMDGVSGGDVKNKPADAPVEKVVNKIVKKEPEPVVADEPAYVSKLPADALPDFDNAEDHLREWIALDELSEEQVVTFCKMQNLCGAKAIEVAHFRMDTIKKLLTEWRVLVPKIKLIKT